MTLICCIARTHKDNKEIWINNFIKTNISTVDLIPRFTSLFASVCWLLRGKVRTYDRLFITDCYITKSYKTLIQLTTIMPECKIIGFPISDSSRQKHKPWLGNNSATTWLLQHTSAGTAMINTTASAYRPGECLPCGFVFYIDKHGGWTRGKHLYLGMEVTRCRSPVLWRSTGRVEQYDWNLIILKEKSNLRKRQSSEASNTLREEAGNKAAEEERVYLKEIRLKTTE